MQGELTLASKFYSACEIRSLMPTYKFTEQAQHDLTQIIRYTLETWGKNQASSHIDSLEEFADSVAHNPKITRQYSSIYDDLRCFPYESHVLYLLEAAHGTTIVRVLHEGMNPALHLINTER
ncbi:MAG: type II toxin-antitoxin system RelE/ParE family toxin [Immundisolibacteraceae bacterium]|nr:type II toxin-antitoxin system RelE/ParE family toxin [Immundisolibacteraceae bacterium]